MFGSLLFMVSVILVPVNSFNKAHLHLDPLTFVAEFYQA